MKNFNKGFAGILGIVIAAVVLVLAGGGAWYYRNKIDSYKPIESRNIPQVQKDETVGWKTYRNKEYGFEVKYPEYSIVNISQGKGNLLVIYFDSQSSSTIACNEYANSKPNSDVGVLCDYENFKISIRNATSSLEESLPSDITDINYYGPLRKTIISGESAYGFIAHGMITYYTALVKHRNNLYEFFFSINNSGLSLTQKRFISSFKFTK